MLTWYYDQVSQLEFFGESHGIPGKIKNAVDRLQISLFVPDIMILKVPTVQ